MGGTYLSLAGLLLAAAVAGQGVFALCGRREWSWLSPAVGLAVMAAVAWGAVNAGGPDAGAIALAMLVVALGGAWVLTGPRRQRSERRPLATGAIVALAAVLLASLPFVVEGRAGILGTSLNPDMSQHLFAADRLAAGGEERLIAEGYPLGPHALVVALTALGPSLVQGFGALTMAVAVATALAPLAILGGLVPWRRAAVALLSGFAYMAASYLIQGAFKETMQALFVLAFALALHQAGSGALAGSGAAARWRLLGGVPVAALAVGSLYSYSFPGIAWLAGALGLWALAELAAARGRTPLRRAAVPAGIAAAAFALAALPELGRIQAFADFETFDPDGAGLGNLFNPISPLEALGIWPSGDFRLDPGDGAAPAAVYWLGAFVGLAALAFGLRWWLSRGERAIPAALGAGLLLYLYALIAGTPYQEAKAIAIMAPLAVLVAARALLAAAPPAAALRRAPRQLAVPVLAAAFVIPAAGCSVLALANGPVGPAEWSPALLNLRASGALGQGGPDGDDTLVLAPAKVLAGEHGEDLFLWELRGGRVCAAELPAHGPPPAELLRGIETVVAYTGPASFEALRVHRPRPGPGCPYIADGDRAEPGASAP